MHLILDVNYLSYRAYHTTGGLSAGVTPTGVLYGVFRELLELNSLFSPASYSFCFDSRKSLRKEIVPTYKENRVKLRNEATEAEKQAFINLTNQISEMRKTLLPEMGFRNIFHAPGYEADDHIASVVRYLSKTQKDVPKLIVSSDHDLYQLLRKDVSLYSPSQKKVYTKKNLWEEFGVKPKEWIDVKAIAGCSSDNIAGVKGVGEKTAAKFISMQLSPSSAAFKKIMLALDEIVEVNRTLVTLPFPGTPEVTKVAPGGIVAAAWRPVLQRFKMHSIRI